MDKSRIRTLKVLMAASVIIVFTLSYIQYALIHNTFELTKEKYYTEVKNRVNEIISLPGYDSLQNQAMENLKKTITVYQLKKLNKQQVTAEIMERNAKLFSKFDAYFLRNLKNHTDLRNIKYKSQYEEIIIELNGHSDTLLSNKDQPIILYGYAFPTVNTLLLNRNEAISLISKDAKDSKNSGKEDLKLIIRTSNYIDVSDWEATVFNRMLGTFILGTVLIIAVIAVFYAVFRTMIRQKKIADMKTDFANNITHELKTPLSSVSLILKSMDRSDVRADAHIRDDLIMSLNRQNLKIQHIVESVLESAMLPEIPVKMEKLDINGLIEHYIADLKLQSHQLAVHLDPKNQILFTDPSLVEKILNVLFENAQNYSGRDTEIRLETYADEFSYFIAITDAGTGIPAAYQDYIFDKFYRVPEQNKHSVKGLGLGLFLAKQAAGKINAQLILKSKACEGSKFIIKLPI